MAKTQRIKDFINGPMKGFSDYNNRRGLPHLMDGQKTGQRKVLDAALDMSSADKIKVSSLGARAVETKAYHHGEASLMDTVVRMACGFPGTNNMPFFDALGSFGTAKNNKNAAPRYIYTRLSKTFKAMFEKEDQKVAPRLYFDGEMVEPEFFIPLLPVILINGADGTGSGYKSFILQYNPKDIMKAVKEVLDTGKVQKPLVPWFNNWTGTVTKDHVTGQATYAGVLDVQTKTRLVVTELPPKYDLVGYKAFLNNLVEKDIIKDYTNLSKTGGWHIEIACTREFTDSQTKEQMMQVLGMYQRETETIVCWGVDKKIRVYDAVEALLEEWVSERVKLAGKSLEKQLASLQEDLNWYEVKARFIGWWIKNSTALNGAPKKEIAEKLEKDLLSADEAYKYFTRLIGTPISQLTKDEIEMLHSQITVKQNTVTDYGRFTPASWYARNIEGSGFA